MTRTIATAEKDSDSSASVRSRTKGVVDERRLQRYVAEAECGLGAREFSAEYCDQGSAIEPRPHLHHRCVIRLVEIVHGRRGQVSNAGALRVSSDADNVLRYQSHSSIEPALRSLSSTGQQRTGPRS